MDIREKTDAGLSWFAGTSGLYISVRDITNWFNLLIALGSFILVAWRLYKDVYCSLKSTKMFNTAFGTPRRAALTSTIIAAMAFATPFIEGEEGKSNSAYLDVNGIPTICYGATNGVNIGDSATDDMCNDLLSKDVTIFAQNIQKQLPNLSKPEVGAAFISLSYNIGITAFNNSSALALAKNGDYADACNAITRFNGICIKRVKGKCVNFRVIKGLVNRRNAEKKLCLSGV